MSAPSFTLAELAQRLGLTYKGDAEVVVNSIAPIDKAAAHQLCFLRDKKFAKHLLHTQASVVLMTAQMAAQFNGNALLADQPELAFARVAALFVKPISRCQGIHETAVIGDKCDIADDVAIGAHCVIGDEVTIAAGSVIQPGSVIGDRVTMGERCLLYARVTLYHDVWLGNEVVIHSGAVIGADGFGLTKDETGVWANVPQLGRVVLHDRVQVGANTCIDRGAIDDTVLDEGVRLDNLIQIAHNVKIGAHTAVCATTGIAGSTKIGKYCIIAGAVGINGHLTISDQVVITAKSAVMSSIEQPGIYSSACPVLYTNQDWRRAWVHFRKLVELNKRVKQLEKEKV